MTLYDLLKERGWWVIKIGDPNDSSWIPVDETELEGIAVTENGEHRNSTGEVPQH